jgi:hypothetical protein
MMMTRILAVYRTDPLMIVVEMGASPILELSLRKLADGYELLPPLLWQQLVEQYQIFQVR